MCNSLHKTSDQSVRTECDRRYPLPKVANLSLICFTLLTQSAVGLVFITTMGHWFGNAMQADISFRAMALALGITTAGLLAALSHLAAPRLAPHALRNPATSWLSREVLLVPFFAAALCLAILATLIGNTVTLIVVEIAACLLGGAALWAMTGVYLLKTVPAWNTPATALEFTGSALLLGGALSAVLTSVETAGWSPALTPAAAGMFLGLIIKLAAIKPAMQAERAARDQLWYQQPAFTLSTGRTLAMRSVLNVAGVALMLASANKSLQLGLFSGLVILVTGEVLGRLRFYRLYGRIGL
jgi:DMSO reductase anchor subunit